MTIIYDNKFNQNELFVLILLITTYSIVFLLPKRFPILISMVYILYAIAVGHFLDHTISIRPFDFYDVNDKSSYEVFDFISYIMYGPFSYFIVYFYDKFELKKRHLIFYIPLWSLTAVFFEYLGVRFGVYHYQKGYKMAFSFPSYLVIITILMSIYYKLSKKAYKIHNKSVD